MPDIDDGVRLNIRPFLLAADVKDAQELLREALATRGRQENRDRGEHPEAAPSA